jgi:Peptidase_C39 like family
MLRPHRLAYMRRLLYRLRWPLIAVTVGLALTIGISAVPAAGIHPSVAQSSSPTISRIGPSPSVAQPGTPVPTPIPTKAIARPSPAASDDFAPIGSMLISVPTQSQLPDLPNGCEVTSLSMLLTAWGTPRLLLHQPMGKSQQGVRRQCRRLRLRHLPRAARQASQQQDQRACS